MRIAQIAPLVERIPPKKYGGTERIVYELTEELVSRGHDVTLFASGDSLTSARLRSVYPRSLREARQKDIYGSNMYTLLNVGLAFSLQDEFDVIHDHTDLISLPTANIARTPVLHTMHGDFNAENRKAFRLFRNVAIATISHAQLHGFADINHAGVVYNGLNMDSYPYGARAGEYLLYVGRITLDKGVHFAVQVAQALDLPLIIAAKLDALDKPYFDEYIEPHLNDRIQWIGEVTQQERNILMSRARCFLHPVTWREPFGLTMIEAMACGCPVVGFNKGSIPEIIVNGITGYVVDEVDEMIEAVRQIDRIDRTACKDHARENFSAKRMAVGYEAIYNALHEGKKDIRIGPQRDVASHLASVAVGKGYGDS